MNSSRKKKPKINIITKGPLRKQIIIPMNSVMANKLMVISNKHIKNNKTLKHTKSDIIADFIQADHKGVAITTNKIISTLDFNTIKKYIKKIDTISFNEVISLRLPQFKLYLKILGIFYFNKDSSFPITSDIFEKVIQSMHIFNDITLTSQPHVIKASPKSDIAV